MTLGLIAIFPLVCMAADPSRQALAWAYPRSDFTIFKPLASGLYHVPGSSLSFDDRRLSELEHPVDWFPNDHPAPPSAVAQSRDKHGEPCAACHLYSGVGVPGSVDLAGLKADYIIAQVHAFREGTRQSWETDRPNTREMIAITRTLAESDLADAAAYYASLPRQSRMHVVEAGKVPATRADHFGWQDRVANVPDEAIDGRIIEIPEDTERLFLGDPYVPIAVYVPIGSIARGRSLTLSGGSTGHACAECHGIKLKGSVIAPPLAGRSPSYLARMLWDIKTNARHDPGIAPMAAVTRGLSAQQIVDLAAYLASLAMPR